MSQDAKFEDGGEQPLRLRAEDTEDLQVVSALIQDAVFPASEIAYRPAQRRFGVLLNRFRWEDSDRAARANRPVERVQTMLVVDDVVRVQSSGLDRSDPDVVLSALAIEFEAGPDGTGRVTLTLAGDGALGLDVECVNVTLQDVTRPYLAPSRKTPEHD